MTDAQWAWRRIKMRLKGYQWNAAGCGPDSFDLALQAAWATAEPKRRRIIDAKYTNTHWEIWLR